MSAQEKEAVSKGGIGSRKSTLRLTGGWRNLKPVFVGAKCTGCGMCVQYCPEGCISLVEVSGKRTKVARVDYDYCKGCMLCAAVCPLKGIEKTNEK
jgi:pyruvate ferredoxin oxidoreductase delta subunit